MKSPKAASMDAEQDIELENGGSFTQHLLFEGEVQLSRCGGEAYRVSY